MTSFRVLSRWHGSGQGRWSVLADRTELPGPIHGGEGRFGYWSAREYRKDDFQVNDGGGVPGRPGP